MAKSKHRSRWEDRPAYGGTSDEPRLEPLFPVESLTPGSRCPHHCVRCGGDGGLVDVETGEPFVCPDCGGSGHGGVPAGSHFVCMVCHRSGLDGTKWLPADVPEPPDPPEADDAEAA